MPGQRASRFTGNDTWTIRQVVRRIRSVIEDLQKGEAEMAGEKYAAAEGLFQRALQQAPRDYAGLVLMAKCQLAQKKIESAATYLKTAQQVYPQEAQTYYLNGYAQLQQKQYDAALVQFEAYDTATGRKSQYHLFQGGCP